MASRLIEILVVAAVVFGMLKLETAWHVWRFNQWKKKQAKQPVVTAPQIVGVVQGGATPYPCTRCSAMVTNYHELNDGSKRCFNCISPEIK